MKSCTILMWIQRIQIHTFCIQSNSGPLLWTRGFGIKECIAVWSGCGEYINMILCYRKPLHGETVVTSNLLCQTLSLLELRDCLHFPTLITILPKKKLGSCDLNFGVKGSFPIVSRGNFKLTDFKCWQMPFEVYLAEVPQSHLTWLILLEFRFAKVPFCNHLRKL